MPDKRRVLGLAATSRACGLTVLEGQTVIYHWTRRFDGKESPVQNLAHIHQTLVSAIEFLQPGAMVCLRPRLPRTGEEGFPFCLYAEAQWISRNWKLRLRSVPIDRLDRGLRTGRLRKENSRSPGTEDPDLQTILRGTKPDSARQALLLAFEVARYAQKGVGRSR